MGKDFRADIEGLRAVAVLAVLLFHAGFAVFSGGYVGVDVFFVISGFLITSLIRRQVADGRFSFTHFYIRRLRRLLPASLCTIVVTFAVAALFFSPHDMARMGGEALYATVSLSNVFYWLQAGYFDADSIRKALLHTWSLGVEEQFYLIWPALIVASLRVPRLLLPTILVAGAASLTACLWMMRTDASAAFFLTPFRVYEFAIGAALTGLPAPARGPARLSFTIGMGLVLYAVFAFGETTLFPGLAALVPALGTALMIWGGKEGGPAAILTIPPMRWIGQISYSLYLTHWPVAVFATYIVTSDQNFYLKPIIFFGAFATAIPLYYLVEQPMREGGRLAITDGLKFGLASALAVIAFLPLAASAWASNGWPWRLPKALLSINAVPKVDYERYLFARNPNYELTPFRPGGPNILIVGDSQASDLLNLFVETGIDKEAAVKILPIETRCGALIIPKEQQTAYWTKENSWTVKSPEIAEACKQRQALLETSPDVAAATVIYLTSLWYVHTTPYIAATVERLQRRTKAQIIVVGRKTQNRGSIELANAHGRLTGLEDLAARNRMVETDTVNATIKSAVGSRFLDILALICPTTERCRVLTPRGKPILFDQSHFSPEGARYIGNLLKPEIRRHMAMPAVAMAAAAMPPRQSHCFPAIEFLDAENWHACEPTGRWLQAMSTTLRLTGIEGSNAVRLRGMTFGARRRMIVSVRDRVVFDAPIDTVDARIELGEKKHATQLDVDVRFEGTAPVSPSSLGLSADTRTLNFMLHELTAIR